MLASEAASFRARTHIDFRNSIFSREGACWLPKQHLFQRMNINIYGTKIFLLKVRIEDMTKQILKNDWAPLLEEEFTNRYYLRLREFLKREYATQTIYPNMHDIFNALHYTPFRDVKVVILGQDPYHGPNQAHGLGFSVQKG